MRRTTESETATIKGGRNYYSLGGVRWTPCMPGSSRADEAGRLYRRVPTRFNHSALRVSELPWVSVLGCTPGGRTIVARDFESLERMYGEYFHRPEGGRDLAKHLVRVELNSMPAEQFEEFRLVVLTPVMLLLVSDVGVYVGHGGLADREPTVALLP